MVPIVIGFLITGQGSGGETDLVILHDSYTEAHAEGGQVKILMESDSLAGLGATVKLFDDKSARNMSFPPNWFGSCANSLRDCHSWDEQLGKGHFSWKWVSLSVS